MNPLYMLAAIPVFLLLIGLELFYAKRKGKSLYRFNDTISNLLIGIGNQAFNLIFKALLLGMYVWAFQHWSFFQLPNTWWSMLLCLIAFDFLFYWAHRWGHEVNLFWGAHLVHHSSEEYNLSVALRQSWFHNVMAFIIFMPLPFLGFDPITFVAAAGLDTVYQFWIHTKAIGKLHPWIEFIFNTPSHHRVHHGRNPKYIDKNHGGVFIIWDRIFGTFQVEEEEVVYGITTPLKSWNPAWANVHYFVELFQASRKFKRLKDKLLLLFRKPGWMPEELGGYKPVPELGKQDLNKYETDCSKPMKAYAFVQFVFVLIGLVAFMLKFKELDWYFQASFLSVIVLSGMICAAILEGRKWVRVAEYGRLALIALSLNSLYYLQYVNWFLVMLVASCLIVAASLTWFTLGILFEMREKSVSGAGN